MSCTGRKKHTQLLLKTINDKRLAETAAETAAETMVRPLLPPSRPVLARRPRI